MEIGWPQGIYLALSLLGAGIVIAKHGQPKTGTENAWPTIIVTGFVLALLWWGGFFG